MDNRTTTPVKFRIPGAGMTPKHTAIRPSDTSVNKEPSNGADGKDTLLQDFLYPKTAGSKRRSSARDLQSGSKRHREEPRATQRAPEAKMTAACDNLDCREVHDLGQCPLANKCNTCHSTHHNQSNCSGACGRSGQMARSCDDPEPATTQSQSTELVPHPDVEGQATRSDCGLEKSNDDETIGIQTQRADTPTISDSDASSLTSRERRLDQEEREHWIDVAVLDSRFDDLAIRKRHLNEKKNARNEFDRKSAEATIRRKEIEKQFTRQLEEIDRQSEEDRCQRARELQAMKKRQDEELVAHRQKQKRRPESALM